jgi:hypothetical protein
MMTGMADLVPTASLPEPKLSPEIQAWVGELTTLWAATGMSINRFAASHPIDKGTVSRYLRGERVPRDRWFLDRLLAIQAEKGIEVRQEVREHLIGLQLQALKVAHPAEHRVRLISDELELANVGKNEAERYARALEEQLADRVRQIDDLTHQRDRLREAWDANRAALEAEKDGLERHIAELNQEIAELTGHLAHARQRITDAEQRCRHLEELLSQSDVPGTSEDIPEYLPLTDPKAVIAVLDSLREAGARTRALTVAEHAAPAVEVSGNDWAVYRLLEAMRQAGAKGAARELRKRHATASAWGMPSPNRPLGAGRTPFSRP